MISQLCLLRNIFFEDFWEVPLEEMYERLVRTVRARESRFYIPSSEHYCKADGYTLWGTYIRNRIIDMQRVQREDGKWGYEKVIIEEFQIQRIRDKETGATHAVLSELFIPYRQYSLRYILFHLRQFFDQDETKTQDEYSGEAGIETKTFWLWLKWLSEHMSLLYGFGLTRSYQDNWQAMKQWVLKICGDISGWVYNSLQKLNLVLFQNRKMPENTKYRNYERPG